jgi:hypothetical protein
MDLMDALQVTIHVTPPFIYETLLIRFHKRWTISLCLQESCYQRKCHTYECRYPSSIHE